MRVLRQPTTTLLSKVSQDEAVDLIYSAAKICYQNEPEHTETADKIEFLQRLLKRRHTSPFEHVSISMVLTTDRGVSYVTYGIPMWRHVLVQRLDPHAHPDTRYLMQKCFEELNDAYPASFGDLMYYYDQSKRNMLWES